MQIAVVCSIVGLLCGNSGTSVVVPSSVIAISHQSRPIKSGWYERDDSRAVGAGITGRNMSFGETGVRCLCAAGFRGYDDGNTFVVTAAPDGYSDTIGRRFKAKQIDCSNCAD